MKVVNERVQIPVQLLSYVQEHKLVKPLSVYLYLKCMSSGKLHKSDPVFVNMSKVLGVKDRRTLNKHMATLLLRGWIGFNPESGYYFIRGISFLRKQHAFKMRSAVTFHYKDIRKIQAFVAGGIISANINSQQYFWEVAVRGKLKSATLNLDVANQDRRLAHIAATQKPAYYGLGIDHIAKILFCKPTRACELKHEAERHGFIKTKEKVKILHIFPRSDLSLKPNLQYAYPEVAHKIQFRKVSHKVGKGKRNMVAMVMQLHDEIKPKMGFKRIRRYSHIASETRAAGGRQKVLEVQKVDSSPLATPSTSNSHT